MTYIQDGAGKFTGLLRRAEFKTITARNLHVAWCLSFRRMALADMSRNFCIALQEAPAVRTDRGLIMDEAEISMALRQVADRTEVDPSLRSLDRFYLQTFSGVTMLVTNLLRACI